MYETAFPSLFFLFFVIRDDPLDTREIKGKSQNKKKLKTFTLNMKYFKSTNHRCIRINMMKVPPHCPQ